MLFRFGDLVVVASGLETGLVRRNRRLKWLRRAAAVSNHLVARRMPARGNAPWLACVRMRVPSIIVEREPVSVRRLDQRRVPGKEFRPAQPFVVVRRVPGDDVVL